MASKPVGTHVRIGAGTLVVPAAIFLLLFYILPLARMLLLSLDAPAFSLRHYDEFFTNSAYLRVLAQTFRLAGTVTLICLVLGYPTACLLARTHGRSRAVLLVMVILPYLTSFVVRSYAWIVLLGRTGIVNTSLREVGLIEEPLALIYNQIGVYIGMVHVMLPFMILPIFSAMQGIDPRLMRAADSLGASPLRAHLAVLLPLSLPGIRSGCVLVFLVSLGFYVTPALLGGLGDVMLASFIDVQITQTVQFGLGSAAALVLLATTLIGFFVVGRVIGASSPLAIDPPKMSKGLRLNLVRSLANWASARHWADLMRKWEERRLIRLEEKGLRPGRISRLTLPLSGGIVLLYLFAPTIIVVPLSFSSAAFLRFPPPGFSLRWYEAFFSSNVWLDPLRLSLEVAVVTAVSAAILGTLAAFGIVRSRFPGRSIVAALLVSPMIVPSIVTGVALYAALSPFGMISTRLGIIVGHLIGALPFVIIVVAGTLMTLDPSYERAAFSLGAGPVRTFSRVTLPLIWTGIVTAALFAFIHSFDELVITHFVAGFRTQTLPLRMWENIRNEIDPTLAAVASIFSFISILALVLMRAVQRFAPQRRYRG